MEFKAYPPIIDNSNIHLYQLDLKKKSFEKDSF